MEWKEKHVVFMVGLHEGWNSSAVPDFCGHITNAICWWVRGYRPLTGFTARLKTLETRAQQFGYSLYTPHQLMPVDWDSVAVP